MASLKIHYDSEGVSAALARLASNVADQRPAFQDIGEYLIESTRRRFARGEAPDGTPWAPKSQATLDAYQARGDGHQPDPLIGPSRRLSTEFSYTAWASGVELGTNLIQAMAMQLGAARGAFGSTSRGSPIPWGDIPSRPFIGLDRDDERTLGEIVEEHILSEDLRG